MNRTKKLAISFMVALLSVFIFTGCGNNKTTDNDSQGGTWSVGMPSPTKKTTEDEADKDDKEDLYSPGQLGDTSGDNGLANGENNGTAGEDLENAGDDAADDVGDAVNDVGKAAEDVVDDVADGVGDAIDNLGGGSFDKYEDAKDYLLDKLKKDNAAANYEVRDETEDLTAYNNNDSGAEGYKFSVYETDGNEKIGIYYVDKDTGKIYRYMGKNSIEAY